ncbi:MAG: hypothetical protein GY722_01275 [bacterium]|nr:hypothetical protein [bacterium]
MGSPIPPRSLFSRMPGFDLEQQQEQEAPPGRLPTPEPQEQPKHVNDALSQVLGNAQTGVAGGAGPELPIPGNQAMGRLMGPVESAVPGLGGVSDMLGGGMDSLEGIATGASQDSPDVGEMVEQVGGPAPEQQEQQSGGGFFSRLLGMGRGLVGRFLGR